MGRREKGKGEDEGRREKRGRGENELVMKGRYDAGMGGYWRGQGSAGEKKVKRKGESGLQTWDERR